MPLADLNAEERAVLKGCLRAAVEGPFFPEWEFSTLFGVTRDEVKHILEDWPDIDDGDESAACAINGSFNNLLGYPHHRQDIWSQFIPVTEEELARIYSKWKGRIVRNYLEGFA